MKSYDTHLAGVLHISGEEFETLEKAERVLYVVDEADGFSLYLGEKPLLNGTLQLLARLEQLQQTLTTLEQQTLTIRQRLGLVQHPFPDVNGDGEVGADDVQNLEEFSARLSAGDYAEFGTIEEKWNAFAAEKGLENSHYISDVNGDGEMRADDTAAIRLFVSECGAGNYLNSADGFRAFMLDYQNAIFGAEISGVRVVSATQYDELEPKQDILYVVAE